MHTQQINTGDKVSEVIPMDLQVNQQPNNSKSQRNSTGNLNYLKVCIVFFFIDKTKYLSSESKISGLNCRVLHTLATKSLKSNHLISIISKNNSFTWTKESEKTSQWKNVDMNKK